MLMTLLQNYTEQTLYRVRDFVKANILKSIYYALLESHYRVFPSGGAGGSLPLPQKLTCHPPPPLPPATHTHTHTHTHTLDSPHCFAQKC